MFTVDVLYRFFLIKIFLIFLCTFVFVTSVWIENPVLEIEDGKIQGKLTKSDDGKPFYEFREVPYAAPPIGDLRFAEPIPPKKWKGVLDATKNTKICVSKPPAMRPDEVDYFPFDSRENEDCLYLNVFTPNLPTFKNTVLLPVYVFIYGGAYLFGDPTKFDFQNFMEEDIVVVTFNYRSASLGFLTTGDGVIPANNGLKDQLMVLKWINKNINKFGGDPEKVTIGGHSSGAMCVGFHVLSTKTKGLFRSAILQSGNSLVSLSYVPNPKTFAFKLGEALSTDFDGSKNTSEDLLKLLRSLPADLVTKTDYYYPATNFYYILGHRSIWGPTGEDPNYKNAFISGPMHENMENGNFNHVPILTGLVDEESKDLPNITDIAAYSDVYYDAVIDPQVNIKKEDKMDFVSELKEIYCNTTFFSQNVTGMFKLMSDMVFGMPIKINAYLHSKYADVHFYEFSYLGPLNGINYWKKFPTYGIKGLGNCAHGDELPLLYQFYIKPTDPPNDTDLLVRKRLVRLWSNFIKYTTPTPKPDSLLQNISWPKMTQENYNYLEIDSRLTMKKDPNYFKEWKQRLNKYFRSPRYWY